MLNYAFTKNTCRKYPIEQMGRNKKSDQKDRFSHTY
jgi:hypothetical protein